MDWALHTIDDHIMDHNLINTVPRITALWSNILLLESRHSHPKSPVSNTSCANFWESLKQASFEQAKWASQQWLTFIQAVKDTYEQENVTWALESSPSLVSSSPGIPIIGFLVEWNITLKSDGKTGRALDCTVKGPTYEPRFNSLDFPNLLVVHVIAMTAGTAFSKILFCQATKRLCVIHILMLLFSGYLIPMYVFP